MQTLPPRPNIKMTKGLKPSPHHPWARRIKPIIKSYQHAHNSVNNPTFTAVKTSSKKSVNIDPIKFTVIGNRVTKEFIYCVYLVNGLHKCKQKVFGTPVIRGLTGLEWLKMWNDLKQKYGGIAYCLTSQVAILKDGDFIGGEKELKDFVESKYVYNVYLDYYKEGIQRFANYIKSSRRPCVYMHISINGDYAGCLIFMLYADIVPFTSQSFLKMCHKTRGGYSGTPVHRIVKDCFIQCGGFCLKNPDHLTCENFIISHDRRGVIGMANNGRHIDCTTQFFVLLQPAPWMKNRYVAIGQLIDGERTLSKIECVKTWYESPTSEIIIERAGILNPECQRMPINKNINQYIDGHIEDLIALGNLFYEELLQRVFNEVELRESMNETVKEPEESTEESDSKTVRFMSKKRLGDDSSVNNEFDVDVYEYENFDEELRITPPMNDEPSPRPTKPYYLSPTDVHYPGEVDSICDLKKLLRGDYCLESDLADLKKPMGYGLPCRKVSLTVINLLFDYLTVQVDVSDTSLSEKDEDIVKNYLKESNDSVSFAGRIVSKMANYSNNKLRLFDDTRDKQTNKEVLTDEDLRLLRMVHKELHTLHDRKVSLDTEAIVPRGLVHRRPTGFVFKEHLSLIVATDNDDDDSDDDSSDKDDDFSLIRFSLSNDILNTETLLAKLPKDKIERHEAIMYGDDDLPQISARSRHILQDIPRRVTISSSPHLLNIPCREGKAVGGLYLGDQETAPRTSVLKRLYDEVDDDYIEENPTLKKLLTEPRVKEILLTTSHFDFTANEDRTNPVRLESTYERNVNQVLGLQHGEKFRKISSDYVRTIAQIECEPEYSIRSVEFSKKRPALTIAQYQAKIHHENLKIIEEKMSTTEDKTTETMFKKSKHK